MGILSAVSVGVLLVLLVVWGSILAGPSLVNAVGSNSDMAAYAVVGQHVADDGPDTAGAIAGFDMGERAQQSFDFGSLAVTAATAVGPFDAVYRYQMPLVAVLVGLIAYVIADLLGRLAPARRRVTWLAGIAAICPILFAYLWSNYFLNELLAIALVLAACVAIVHGATRPTTRAYWPTVPPRRLRRRPCWPPTRTWPWPGRSWSYQRCSSPAGSARPAARAVGRPGHRHPAPWRCCCSRPSVWRLPTALRDLSSVDAGWKLPGFPPSEILGFVSTVEPHHGSVAQWIPSVVILAVIAVAAVWLVRGRHAPALGRFTFVLFPLALASYWYVYRSGGRALVTAVEVDHVLHAGARRHRRCRRHGQHRGAGAQVDDRPERIASAAGIAYCVVASANSGTVGYAVGSTGPSLAVTSDLATLDTNPGLDGIEELNVDVAPYWETMWVSYFLRDRARVAARGALRLLDERTGARVDPAAPRWADGRGARGASF